MDYRDWAPRDRAPRERYPAEAWADEREQPTDSLSALLEDDGLQPGGPYAPSYSTPSRRRGASPEEADRYTPAWASEPEAEPAPRGGRHRGEPPGEESWRAYVPGGRDSSAGYPSRWESTETTTSRERMTETSDWSRQRPVEEAVPERPQDGRRTRDTSGDLLGLRDPFPDDPPPVGRRRAADDADPPPVPRRRRAIEAGPARTADSGPTRAVGAGPARTAESEHQRAIESAPRRAVEAGPARTADARPRRAIGAAPEPVSTSRPDPPARSGGRRRAEDDDHGGDSTYPTTTGREYATGGEYRSAAASDQDEGGLELDRWVEPRRRAEPGRRRADVDSDGDSAAVNRWERSAGVVPEVEEPAPRRRWDRPGTDDQRWRRAVEEGPAETTPARGAASVPRVTRSTTYGPRRTVAADADPGADRPGGPVDPPEADPDPGDRRGRFIEASGWGRSADTTEWERATADDSLYRSPDPARRDRGGGDGRRGRSGGDGRRSRADTERGNRRTRTDGGARAESGRRTRPSGDLERRDRPAGDSGRRIGPTAQSPTSGVTGWQRPSSDDEGWGRSTGSDRWDGMAETGQWDRFTDTGPLDRVTDTGQLDRLTDTGQWDRFTDTTEWSRGEMSGLLDRDGGDGGDGRPWHDSGETFWSGTRLAGDDPRWVNTPETAPRSPAVAYPSPPRSRLTAPVGSEDRVATQVRTGSSTTTYDSRPGYRSGSGYQSRPSYQSPSGYQARTGYASRGAGLDSISSRRRSTARIEDDLLDADPGSPLTAVLYAAAWYAVPVLVFFVWLLTLDGSAPVGCVTDVTGGGCESARAKAMASMLSAAPRFGLAMMVSLVTAVLLRWASPTWRTGSVGLAAAVVGGGLSTVLVSVISGQSLG
nr:hypothetical protein [Micromonospora sp. DSM 115978]